MHHVKRRLFPQRVASATPLIPQGLSSSFREALMADNGQTEALVQQESVWTRHGTDVHAREPCAKHGE